MANHDRALWAQSCPSTRDSRTTAVSLKAPFNWRAGSRCECLLSAQKQTSSSDSLAASPDGHTTGGPISALAAAMSSHSVVTGTSSHFLWMASLGVDGLLAWLGQLAQSSGIGATLMGEACPAIWQARVARLVCEELTWRLTWSRPSLTRTAWKRLDFE